MGRVKLQTGIKAIEEENATNSHKSTIACIINSEIGSVLAVMRRNVRWGGRYMAASVAYHQSAVYLQPFLDVIRSDETGAPITGVALSSVYNILTVDVIHQNTVNVDDAMHMLVDAITSCRFEVTDPASEEVVLMKILQVLLACMRSKASVMLSNQHVCTIVNTCFRIVHQAGTKDVHRTESALVNGNNTVKREVAGVNNEYAFGSRHLENGSLNSEYDLQQLSTIPASNDSSVRAASGIDETTIGAFGRKEAVQYDLHLMTEPYGVPCMVEIFHFLCSLLNVSEHMGMGPRSNTIAFDEDVPLFSLVLINSVIELGGVSIQHHPKLLNLLEAFFSCVILRLAQSRYGASYQQQEVAMEALVDFCRQKNFMVEMYANLDCDITCSNVFEELANLLSKSAFPVNCPLSSFHILALDGLIAVIQGIAERVGNGSVSSAHTPVNLEEYTPFWMVKCDNYSDPNHWVPFVRRRKYIKRRLTIGADHFNHDPKKGLEFLQGTHLLPDKLDPQSVACFFRYTAGLDKNLVGDFLGNHDEFCVQVLHKFAGTFDFQDMNLDTALRLFLETFRLPGESQKIQRVLEAFSERYYEQSPLILANKDAALLLSYSIIMLNTDQQNVQVKKKMTEEDFIRNNRHINGGSDLPREFLAELYHSICKNEIRTTPEQGAGYPEMTPCRWIGLMHKSKKNAPFIVSDSRAYLDHDMFAIISGPTIAAISVVFDHAEHEEVYQTCIDGFLAIAKISACHHLEDVLDDLVVSLCKFTTLLNPSSVEEPVLAFGDDTKARMSTVTVFTIANRYGDYIRTGWRNILDCILRLNKLGLLPARVASNAADESEFSADAEEPRSQPTEQQLAAHQRTLQTIQKCHIDGIFTESKFLQPDSLLQLARALIGATGRPQKGNSSPEDDGTAVFCLELLIAITLNNRDRIVLLWQGVYEHVSNIVQSTVMPCALVEKAVFGLLRICQRLLPYKENLADELLRSLQFVLKLDARVADAYCEQITLEVSRLVKANASHIRTQLGWHTITSLISITARPEASEAWFDTLSFIMSDGTHLLPTNYILCVDASKEFAESRVGQVDRSVCALDLMAGSVDCLARWAREAKLSMNEEDAVKMSRDIGEMWLRLVQGLRKVCLDQREVVRNHALLLLRNCLTGVDGIPLPYGLWLQCFDLVIFTVLDDLFEIAQVHSQKEYRNMEGTLILAMQLLSKVFLQLLPDLSHLTTFCKVWPGVISRMGNYMKVKVGGRKSEKLQDEVPELLKNTLLVMHLRGVPVQKSGSDEDGLWEQTLLHVNKIAPSLQAEVLAQILVQSHPQEVLAVVGRVQ
ncbi:hypothetical protein ACLB2K_073714 [Fragaria x ananassa]